MPAGGVAKDEEQAQGQSCTQQRYAPAPDNNPRAEAPARPSATFVPTARASGADSFSEQPGGGKASGDEHLAQADQVLSDEEVAWRLHQELNATSPILRTRSRKAPDFLGAGQVCASFLLVFALQLIIVPRNDMVCEAHGQWMALAQRCLYWAEYDIAAQLDSMPVLGSLPGCL